MTTAAFAKRLAEVEARLRSLRPKAPVLPAQLWWVEFCTCDELDSLEELFATEAADDRELTQAEERSYLAIYAAALSRQLAGWPEWTQARDRYEQLDHPNWPTK